MLFFPVWRTDVPYITHECKACATKVFWNLKITNVTHLIRGMSWEYNKILNSTFSRNLFTLFLTVWWNSVRSYLVLKLKKDTVMLICFQQIQVLYITKCSIVFQLICLVRQSVLLCQTNGPTGKVTNMIGIR